MKRMITVAAIVGALLLPTSGAALAADPHTSGSTGQPSQNCAALGFAFPGHTGTSPGSAFNGSAGSVYANPTSQGGMSSGNLQVVAQYDVACFQQTQH
jgi:hypothetical protein